MRLLMDVLLLAIVLLNGYATCRFVKWRLPRIGRYAGAKRAIRIRGRDIRGYAVASARFLWAETLSMLVVAGFCGGAIALISRVARLASYNLLFVGTCIVVVAIESILGLLAVTRSYR